MKSGQAAIEFLTTYGWMFMIVLVVSGGLVYFGVFNVNNLVPDSCDFGGGIYCPLHALNYDAGTGQFTISLQLHNGLGNRITIDSISAKDVGAEVYCKVNLAPTVVIAPGQDDEFVFNFDTVVACPDSFFDVTEKRKYDVRLYYLGDGATQKTSLKGRIVSAAS